MNRSRVRLPGLELTGESIMAVAVSGMAVIYLGMCLLYRLERDQRWSRPQPAASPPVSIRSTAHYRALLTDLQQAKGPVVVQSLKLMAAQAPQTINAWAPLPSRPPLVLTLSIPLTPVLAHHYALQYDRNEEPGEYDKIQSLRLGDRVSFDRIKLGSLPNEPEATLPPSRVLWLNTMIRPSAHTVWLEVTTP